MPDRDTHEQSGDLFEAVTRLFDAMIPNPARRSRPPTWAPFQPTRWAPADVRGVIGVQVGDEPLRTYTIGPEGFKRETAAPTASHIDIEEMLDELRVVADLPGVTASEIDLQCDGRTLTITAAADDRQYDDQVRLPTRVAPGTAVARFNNGVLAVTVERADSLGGQPIDIE